VIPLQTPSGASRPTAIALGSFDGLHRGHRSVIAAISAGENRQAACDGPVPTVVSFWPHPREVLYGEKRLRLDLPREKLSLLEPLGIRQLVMVPFDRELATLSPEEFITQVLSDQLQAHQIAVGENFRFGAGRRGDCDDLVRIGRRHGIDVTVLPSLEDGDGRLSSSRIRRALAAGQLTEAQRLLDRPYRFSGTVIAGRGLGRELGWPTLNIAVDGRKFLPMEGVYAARAWRAGGGSEPMAAVMNLGPQPTLGVLGVSSVEVHLLDRRLDLYGSDVTVEPVRYLRGQRRFDNLRALSEQIGRDSARARDVLLAMKPCPQA
jgi:riboflavin kinase/FMN adenylyltransferase